MQKFKIGDKIIAIKNLKEGFDSRGLSINYDMLSIAKNEEVMTILEFIAEEENYQRFRVKENCWSWTNEMVEPYNDDILGLKDEPKKTKSNKKTEANENISELVNILKSQVENTNNIFSKYLENANAKDEQLEKIFKEINKKSLIDETIQNKILEKAKDIELEELKNDLSKWVEKFVNKNYGLLPKTTIEVKNNKNIKEIKGLFHKDFEKILNIVNANIPLMLVGGAGAGKNHTLEQVAKALELDFYFTNAVTQEYKLTGFIDANGIYQETQFYKAFKDGGLFFLDEIDASTPETLIILNSAIANKYFDFPIGRINANENFRIVSASNTFGSGGDMVYSGRNALDGATLDRFIVIKFDYDEAIEKQLAYDDELYIFIKTLREIINKEHLRFIVSMRATINATKLLNLDFNKRDILELVIFKGINQDDFEILKTRTLEKLPGSNNWYDILRTFSYGRD